MIPTLIASIQHLYRGPTQWNKAKKKIKVKGIKNRKEETEVSFVTEDIENYTAIIKNKQNNKP